MNIIILAAGEGSRMQSSMPKVMNEIAGFPILYSVIVNARAISESGNIIVVASQSLLSYCEEKDLGYIFEGCKIVIQQEKLGTANAVKVAIDSEYFNHQYEKTLILYGDQPFFTAQTITETISSSSCPVSIVCFYPQDETQQYARITCSNPDDNEDYILENGLYIEIDSIKEFKEYLDDEKMPTLCNSGLMLSETKILSQMLSQVNSDNAAKEYYLTDIINIAKQNGISCGAFVCDEIEVLGINNQFELENATKVMYSYVARDHMSRGVRICDTLTTFISQDAIIGKNVIIEPNVFIGKSVEIGDNIKIKSFSYLEDVKILNNSDEVKVVGPFYNSKQ
jgi:bifunctional UDP-N-acetylglucosamine pyrophosphorylase/glucosamine-1-phosphate N-acetyltransferase